jgi:hypothetical protein
MFHKLRKTHKQPDLQPDSLQPELKGHVDELRSTWAVLERLIVVDNKTNEEMSAAKYIVNALRDGFIHVSHLDNVHGLFKPSNVASFIHIKSANFRKMCHLILAINPKSGNAVSVLVDNGILDEYVINPTGHEIIQCDFGMS